VVRRRSTLLGWNAGCVVRRCTHSEEIMHRTVAHLIVGLTVTAFWGACGKSKPDPGQRKPNELIPPLDPPTTGTIGHNGLRPEDFLGNLRTLEVAMKAGLTAPPPPGSLHSSLAPLLPTYQTLADDATDC